MKAQAADGGLLDSRPGNLVLGIDPSYAGFAVTAMAQTGEPLYHSWLYASSGVGVKRVISIRDFLASLDEALRWWHVKEIAMEGYAPGARFGREMAGELCGMVKIWLWENLRIEPLLVSPSQLKKYVTGKGTQVQKNQMLLQTYKKWDVEFHDDNLCDSYGLARLASGRHDTAYESEIVNRIKR